MLKWQSCVKKNKNTYSRVLSIFIHVTNIYETETDLTYTTSSFLFSPFNTIFKPSPQKKNLFLNPNSHDSPSLPFRMSPSLPPLTLHLSLPIPSRCQEKTHARKSSQHVSQFFHHISQSYMRIVIIHCALFVLGFTMPMTTI